MQRKNTLIMTLSLIIVGLFIGAAVASDSTGLARDTADRYIPEELTHEPIPEAIESEAEIVEGDCLACQPQPLDGGENTVATDGETLTPDCPTCKEVVIEAWNYAMDQVTFIFDINPDDLIGMSLFEKLLYLRNAIRAPFRSFAKHFGIKLLEKIDELPFSIFEAIGGSGVIFTTEWFRLLAEYGFQPSLITLEALNSVKDYVIELCNGEDNGTNQQSIPTAQPTNTVSQPIAAQPVMSGTMSL